MTLLLLLVKASLLLAATLAAAWLLRGSTASARHALWSAAFVSLLALPVLAAAVPALRVPLPAAWAPRAVDDTAPPPRDPGAMAVRASAPPGGALAMVAAVPDGRVGTLVAAAGRTARLSVAAITTLAWLAGAVTGAAFLLLSLHRARRLARSAEELVDEGWLAATARLSRRVGLRRTPRLRVSTEVRTPMAGGLWRPTVFLPADANVWTAERREVVLAHELSHLARRDPLRHIAARVALACYWFHPLAWIGAKEATLAREQACDEAVLALGVRPSDYARVLLELAESMTPSAPPVATLPMIERSLLEKRLMAILTDRSRPSVSRPMLATAAAACLTVALAAAQPAVQATPAAAGAPSQALPVVPPASAPATFAGDVVATSSLAVAQPANGGCWIDDFHGSFRGSSTTIDNAGGRAVVTEMIGTRNGDRVVQTHFGDTRVCMVAEGAVGLEDARPSQWSAPRVLLETRRGGATQQMEIRGAQITWRVNGAERPVDQRAQAWRSALLAALDQVWDISTLRGQVSTLRGQESTIRGEESSLRGQISSLGGEVSSMRGEESTVRGQESSLRGQISSIEGQLSSLRGQISSEQGAISSLNAGGYGGSGADRDKLAAQIKSHDDEIARLERQIRDYDAASRVASVEKQIQALDADGKSAAIEDRIRTFDEAGKVAAIEKQIQALNVDGKTAEIEQRIASLDADRRTRQMQDTLDDAIKQLDTAIAAIR